MASFLAPLGLLFGVPFGSPFGAPATGPFGAKTSGNNAFWALEAPPKRSFRVLFWMPFWLPFAILLGGLSGWSMAMGISCFCGFIFSRKLFFQFNYGGSRLDRNNARSISLNSSFSFLQDNTFSRQQLQTGPSGLKMKLC